MVEKYRISKDKLHHLVYSITILLFFLGIHFLTESIYLTGDINFFKKRVLVIHQPTLLILLLSSFILFIKPLRAKIAYPLLLPNQGIRISLFILIFLIAWNLIFYEYNFYYDQWHFLDRLLLLLLLILSWRSPLFILPFLAQLYLLISQFQFPLGGFPILDKRLPIQILNMSVSIALIEFIRSFLPRINKLELPITKIWFYFAACIFGAFYFHSALQKIEISPTGWEWLRENDILNNLSAMHERGWLKNWPILHSLQVRFFSAFNHYGQLFILVMEFCGLLLLLHRRLFIVFAGSMILFHISVFFLNGALFIPWIICGISLIWIAKKTKAFAFSGLSILFSMLFIFFLPEFLFVPKLAWFDSKLDSKFELYEKDKSGQLEKISLYSLAPYNENFQVGNLLPLVKTRAVGIGFLQVEYPHFKALQEADSAAVQEHIRVSGYSIYQEEKNKDFLKFMALYKKNHSKAKTVNKFLHFIQLPHYFNADASRPPTLVGDEENIQLQFNVYYKEADNRIIKMSSEQVYPSPSFQN